jgi:hybrid polyketide synthase/nonribosomal peptide synthetase ACE1
MQEGVIPPNLHFDQLNPSVVPFYQGLHLVTSPQPWPALPAGIPRRSSINSFGFGGTNAHVIIETLEAPLNGFERNTQLTAEPPRPVLPFTFSAKSEKSLRALVQSYETYLKVNDSIDLRCLAYTLSCRRSALPYKTAFLQQAKKRYSQNYRQLLQLKDKVRSAHDLQQAPTHRSLVYLQAREHSGPGWAQSYCNPYRTRAA